MRRDLTHFCCWTMHGSVLDCSQPTRELLVTSHTCVCSNPFSCRRVNGSRRVNPGLRWFSLALSENTVERREKCFGLFGAVNIHHKHMYMPHLPWGPTFTLTRWITRLYDLFFCSPFALLSGTRGEQQKCGWTSTKTFTTPPCPLRGTSLMESKCDGVRLTDEPLINWVWVNSFYQLAWCHS